MIRKRHSKPIDNKYSTKSNNDLTSKRLANKSNGHDEMQND